MTFTETTPLPSLRYDLDGFEVMPGIIALYDNVGYSEATVQLSVDVIDYLLYMDGKRTLLELAGHAARSSRPFDSERFLELVEILEEEYFLDTPRFHARRNQMHEEYNSLRVRPMAHAGACYPEDPNELREVLDEYLGNDTPDIDTPVPIGIFAPHVDPRVGGSTYGPAYNALRNSDADTFIILGVPHLMSYDRFMISRMDVDTPLGVLPTDREFIDALRAELSFGLTTDELAHRQEHSIEFQSVFLRHVFPDRDIKIVPILAGSLHQFVESGRGGANADAHLTEFYQKLAETGQKLGRKVCWIASVDFCHIGKKFGDTFPAAAKLTEIREHDMKLIEEAVRPDAEAFLQRLVDVKNTFRVCGTSPMYAFLRAVQPAYGKLLAYDQWDETEQESAVSFAALAFYAESNAIQAAIKKGKIEHGT